MSETDAVLFANEAFYRAFADRDLKAMDEIWARALPIACIHPGWPALIGREAVMTSWRRILSGAGAPQIACREAEAFLRGEMAFVVCYEEITGQFLVATNVFAREGGRWKLVHHQAGPSPAPPAAEEDEPEPPPRPN